MHWLMHADSHERTRTRTRMRMHMLQGVACQVCALCWHMHMLVATCVRHCGWRTNQEN